MIEPPFSSYPRAKLERLVREGFEKIELAAYEAHGGCCWDTPTGTPMDPYAFQVLMAADHYLRSTKAQE